MKRRCFLGTAVAASALAGCLVVTGHEPNADPDHFGDVDELEEAWAGETTEVEVAQAASH